jgi:hypothetical protein
MNQKTLYLLLLVSLCSVCVFIFRKADGPKIDATTSLENAATNASAVADQTTEATSRPASLQQDEPKVVAEKPIFAPPVTPRIQELRKDVVRPVREMKDDADMVRMGDAMGELSRMRNIEATNVLAELLFANKQEYFSIRYINGVRHSSFSYQVMLELYCTLEGTPEPLDGAVHHDADLPIFQDWWLKNKDHLVFRDPKKPVPMPWGMRGDGKPPVKKP